MSIYLTENYNQNKYNFYFLEIINKLFYYPEMATILFRFYCFYLINYFIFCLTKLHAEYPFDQAFEAIQLNNSRTHESYINAYGALEKMLHQRDEFCNERHDNLFCHSDSLNQWSQQLVLSLKQDILSFLSGLESETNQTRHNFPAYLNACKENLVFLKSYYAQIQNLSSDIDHFSTLLIHVDEDYRLQMSEHLAFFIGNLTKSNQALWDLIDIYQKTIETYIEEQEEIKAEASRRWQWFMISTATITSAALGYYLYNRGFSEGSRTLLATTAVAIHTGCQRVRRSIDGSAMAEVGEAMGRAIENVVEVVKKHSPRLSPRGAPASPPPVRITATRSSTL